MRLKLRASIRLNQGQVDAAIADLREALNDQPRSPDLMLMLASAYERSGSIDLADKQFADAMKALTSIPLLASITSPSCDGVAATTVPMMC